MGVRGRASLKSRLPRAAWCAVGIVLLTLCPVTTALAGPDDHQRVLQYVRAEEQMAADLFSSLDEVYDARLLSRIAREERVHVALVSNLLRRQAGTGDYADYPGLQQDYWRWLAEGYHDLHSAAEVGIAVERQHLAVLDAALATPMETSARRALREVRRDDTRHLAAFLQLLASTPPAQACAASRC